MEFASQVIAWLTDPAHWSGANGIPVRVEEHVALSGVSLLAGLAVALPIGLFIGHTGRYAGIAISISNIGRALPSVGVLGIAYSLTLYLNAALGWKLGVAPTLIALTFLAIPPVVTSCHVGLREVDRDLVEAAQGMGMRGSQLLRRVELPLAMPVILAGVRTSAVQVVATATLGAIVSAGGLGRFIVDGFAQHNYPMMVGGSLLVMALALATETLTAGLQRASVSPGLRGAAASRSTAG